MKSVGETMAIGRTFKESLQKALRGLEAGRFGLGLRQDDAGGPTQSRRRRDQASWRTPTARLVHRLRPPGRHDRRGGPRADRDRPLVPAQMRRAGRASRSELRAAAALDRAPTTTLARRPSSTGSPTGSSASLAGTSPRPRSARAPQARGIGAVFKLVDTCAAEFEAYTPYYYSTYEDEDEARPDRRARRSSILGGGPNRIGQGIEFDYCCCQAAFALREAGLRGDHGQLQPGDRQHRLRHVATTSSSSR